MNRNESPDYRVLADLLPFYVTGKLPLADMERVEHALAEDEALRRELALVEEEQVSTVHANEMLGLPSSNSAQRFFAALEAEPTRTTPRAFAKGVFAWIGERLQALAPRQMAYAGVAAALLLVAQAGFIGALLHGQGGGGIFGTASAPDKVVTGEGNYAMIAFKPEAKAADVTRLLEASHLRVVDGPRAGGFFRVWIGPKDMPQADREAIIAKLQGEKSIIRFAALSVSQ